MAARNYPAIPTLYLKTDLLSTDSTFKLRDIVWYTESDGTEVTLTAADFGSSVTTAWGVFEPRTSRQEFFRFTTSTITSATTTGVTIDARGLPWGSDYSTEDSGRKFAHPSGSKVLIFTDYGAFWDTFLNKANAETITGVYTFTSTAKAKYNAHPTFSADEEIIDKKYADDLAIAGSPDASTTVKGIVEIATGAELAAGTGTGSTGAVIVPAGSSFTNTSAGAGDANKVPVLGSSGEIAQGFLDTARTIGAVYSFTADRCQITSDADSSNDAVRQSYLYSESSLARASGTSGEAITAGQPIYLKASDGKLWRCDADADESAYAFVGIAVNTTAAADLTQYYTRPGGIATGLSGLTTNSYYFLSGTTGSLATSPHATRPVRVGQALSATTLRVISPTFYQSGSATITGTGDTVITTGFYPVTVRLAGFINGGTTGSVINTSDTSCFAVAAATVVINGSNAFLAIDGGGTTAGTISARTQTTFTVNTNTKNSTDSVTLFWQAWSY